MLKPLGMQTHHLKPAKASLRTFINYEQAEFSFKNSRSHWFRAQVSELSLIIVVYCGEQYLVLLRAMHTIEMIPKSMILIQTVQNTSVI